MGHTMSTRRGKKEPRQVWIGLVEVTSRPGLNLLDGGKGAFVNTLALAASRKEYRAEVTHFLEEIGFNVLKIRDIESFNERQRKYHVDDSLLRLAKEVQRTGSARYDTFFSWTESSPEDNSVPPQ
jgi:hypothetical protein